jgi:hypothetical protein
MTPMATLIPSRKRPKPVTSKKPLARDERPMTMLRKRPDTRCTKYISVVPGCKAKNVAKYVVKIQRPPADARAKADPARPIGSEIKRKQMRGSNRAECIQLEKACYEASIPSEAKPTMHHEEKEQAEVRVKR